MNKNGPLIFILYICGHSKQLCSIVQLWHITMYSCNFNMVFTYLLNKYIVFIFVYSVFRCVECSYSYIYVCYWIYIYFVPLQFLAILIWTEYMQKNRFTELKSNDSASSFFHGQIFFSSSRIAVHFLRNMNVSIWL